MPGADKIISYDPPGAIGLIDSASDPVILLRLNEVSDSEFPVDSAGVLQDLGRDVAKAVTGVTLNLPTVVPCALGRGRRFAATAPGSGFSTRDRVSGGSLLTRDVSIQVVLAWNAAGQTGSPGNIISRGLGGSAAEFVAWGLRIDLISAPTFTGSLRWFWQDVAGVDKLQTGAQLTMTPGQFSMLTATRRWVSPTSVVLNYYIGDQLIGTVQSADGSIGGGTTGATQVGSRVISGVDSHFLAADVDEIMVVDRELCAEEIEDTWLRLTLEQPRGTKMFLELHEEGFPMPDNPASDFHLDTRMAGQALGLASASIENLRRNFLPGRAYGTLLDQWEQLVRPPQRPTQDIAVRRQRVISRMRQRLGASTDGVTGMLSDIIGGAPPSALQYLAFTNTITDDFTTLNLSRWDVTPVGAFSAVSGKARVTGSGTLLPNTGTWRTCMAAAGGNAAGAHMIAKLVFTTPQSIADAGVFFGDPATGNYLLLGLRDNAGVFEVVTESYVAMLSQGLVVRATLGANPAAVWFHLWQRDTPGTWTAEWSTTSGTAGFTASPVITHPTVAVGAGLYLRSLSGSSSTADFDDVILRCAAGERPYNAYVLLDRALGFSPDVAAARAVVADVKHAYIDGTFITTSSLLCDDIVDGCDVAPMGGI